MVFFNGFRPVSLQKRRRFKRQQINIMEREPVDTSIVVSNDKTCTLSFHDTEPVGLLLVATSEYDSDIIMTLSKAELHRACIPKNKVGYKKLSTSLRITSTTTGELQLKDVCWNC